METSKRVSHPGGVGSGMPTPTPRPIPGTEFYASPAGLPTGNGSINRPWDLGTALGRRNPVKPGATVWLRGGVYAGKFASSLTGTQANPITVRSYPGEWAKIDGYVTSALTASVNASQATMTVADASKFSVGSVVTFHDQAAESAEEQAQIGDKTGNVLSVNRGWNGTTPKSHSAGALLVLGGNQLTVSGSDTIYRDFEIMNSDPVRSWGAGVNGQSAPHLRGSGVFHSGPRTKLVNLVLHDNDGGIYGPASSVDSETYGCIIYNNGYVDANGPAGHGWYIQNNPGSTKTYRDDITFNNQFFGFQEESVSGNTVNIINDGLVVFNNPVLVGANAGIVDNITFTNGFVYARYGNFTDGLRLGYQGSNGAITVTGNYLAVTGNTVLRMTSWVAATVTGNTFVAKGVAVDTKLAHISGATGNTTWSSNRYYDTSNIVPHCLPGPDVRATFAYNGIEGPCSNLTFAQWRSNSGLDANVTDLRTSAPTNPDSFFYSQTAAPPRIFVIPNQYDSGRANIVIYNWPLSDKVNVNLSTTGLTNGQTYEIRDAENYFAAPVVQGTYNSASPIVSIPMTGLTAAQPIGLPARKHTAPQFGAFVVIKTSASPLP